MAESRVFRKAEGITIEGIGRSVQNFLRSSKGLVVQGGVDCQVKCNTF